MPTPGVVGLVRPDPRRLELLLARLPDGEPEVFATIQGEGASIGTAAVFVRLSACNLQCSWCDTPYTWDWHRFRIENEAIRVPGPVVVERITRLAGPRTVVVTGGEPLLQRRGLTGFFETLKSRGYRIEVETNGTLAPGELAALVDQWNVSPKLPNAGNTGLRPVRIPVLRAFARTGAAWLKLVVQTREDLAAAEALQRSSGFPVERTLLMPEGRTADEIAARSAWLAEACVARGYRFSTRLHILLWGDRRGV